MEIQLTENQAKLATWLVQQNKAGLLPEEFSVRWKLKNYKPETGEIVELKGKHPQITYAALLALENAGLILTTHQEITSAQKSGEKKNQYGGTHYQFGWPKHETRRSYTLLGAIFALGLFDVINEQIDLRQELSIGQKQELKEVVKQAEDEASQQAPSEEYLTKYFKKLALMAPDLLDVAISAASAPAVGPVPVAILIAKKVAEKAKTDAQNHKAG